MQEETPVQSARGKFGRPGPYRGVFSEAIRGVSWLFLKAAGWHVATDWPGVAKSVVIAAPHTSNLDGLLMLAIAGWYRQKLSWMGKVSLVSGPFGELVRRSGCIPVDRSKAGDLVTQMRQAFDAADSLHLAISPEGTRDPNPDWKTGFWHIAKSANVPVLIAVLDFGAKQMRFEGPMTLSEDAGADLAKIVSHYRHAKGRYPDRFRLPD